MLEFSGIGQGLHQNLGDLTSGGERIELVGGANAAYPSTFDLPISVSRAQANALGEKAGGQFTLVTLS